MISRSGTWRETQIGHIGGWTLRILLALAFAAAGIFKLSGQPATIQEFADVGVGQWLRYATAALELLGAGLLLWPRLIAVGAAFLAAVCAGAFFAQMFRLHGDVIHTIVLGLILVAIVWFHREQLTADHE